MSKTVNQPTKKVYRLKKLAKAQKIKIGGGDPAILSNRIINRNK